jgi:hypothetical protein
VKRRKIDVQRRSKYGGLSGKNPLEKNFEVWIRWRVNIYSREVEIFQAIRSQRISALVNREELS